MSTSVLTRLLSAISCVHLPVSQSWSLTVRSSRYIVFDKKSMPRLAPRATRLAYRCLVGVIKGVIHLASAKFETERAKRVIKLVFPTLCSPRKTSLNFLSGLVDDEKSGEVMVMVESQVAQMHQLPTYARC